MGRNFLDLANAVLGEMYWEQVDDFTGLTTTEGERVKAKLNQILQEIVIGQEEAWTFRERQDDLILVGGVCNYEMPNGFIRDITPYAYPAPLIYTPEYKYMPLNAKGRPVRYWIYDGNIRVYPTPNPEDEGFTFRIRYYTDNTCLDNRGNEKPYMTEPEDQPIIPDKYRDVLVYGACKDLRGNATDPKSEFYNKRYRDLYKRMLSECRRTVDFPNGLHTGNPISIQQSYLNVFYNPRAYGGGIRLGS